MTSSLKYARNPASCILIADVWQDAERFYRSRGWTPPGVVLLRKRFEVPPTQPAVAVGRDPRLARVHAAERQYRYATR